MRLSDIKPYKSVKIVRFLNDDNVKLKLQNIGVNIDDIITVCNIAPLNTPIEIKCKNIRLAIAKSEAEKIVVEYV
ncbi:MAG: ferrous iron transport protein A [Clostridia bacterium]|nr:ferrous iron transport protein A [Clostridia bacterium]